NRGLISTQGDLAVTAHHLTQRGGRLASGGTSTYRLGGTLDNLGRLTGVGNVDITTSYLNNRGTLGSQADLRIVSRGRIDNRPDTLLFAGGDMTLRGTRLFNRYGDIYSRGNLDFARNDRHAKAERLENRSGTIEAEGDISLYAGNIVNTKDRYQEELSLVDRSATATKYNRHRYYLYVDHGGRDSGTVEEWRWDGGWSFYEYELQARYETEVAQDSPAARLVAGGDMAIRAGEVHNANSLIAANGNLHIQADTLKNQGAQHQSVFKRTSYGNPQALAGLTPTKVCRHWSGCFNYYGNDYGNKRWYRVWEAELPADLAASLDDWNANDGRDAQGNALPLPEALAGSEQLSQVVTRTPLRGGDKAVISAGGRVSINVTDRLDNGKVDDGVRNQLNGSLANTATSGVVDALDITLARRSDGADAHSAREYESVTRSDASATDNLASADFNATMVETGRSAVDPTSLASTDLDAAMVDTGRSAVNPTPLASTDPDAAMVKTGRSAVDPTPLASTDPDVAMVETGRSAVDPTPLASTDPDVAMVETGRSAVDSSPLASTDLDAAMVEAGQETVDPSPFASTDRDVSMVEAGRSAVSPGQMADSPGEVATYRDVPFERVSPTQLSSFRLPRGRYGLFVRNTAPQSRYLIETNPEFTSADKLMGSDYLLDKLDYTDDSAYKLLGDGRYESRLVRDAVLANTGQRFLENSLNDDYAQYRHLMDNAVAAKDALQLSVGVGLTPAQTAALTHDIVWLEEQRIEGETVLAPVLYLAQVDERNVRGNSLIQGRDIDLIAGGDLVNVGTIRASHDLAATSGGSILQGGLLEAGERLDLSARDSIRNALAGEIRGGQVSLLAREGDIVNDRTAVTAGHERSYATYLDQGGLIRARDGLDLSAGRDIVNRAEIVSQGDVAFLAGRDIVSEAVADVRRQVNGYESDVGEGSERTTQLGASFTTGGEAALIAGRDVTVTASDIIAEEALAVTAARDIRLEAGENTTHDWGETDSRRWYAKERTDERTTTQVGSQLSSGGDTDLSAGRDVRLAASEIDSRAGLAIEAGNDIVLDAAENTSQTQARAWRRESQTRSVEQAGSELKAREDIALQAERHITAIASRAEAGGDAFLIAGRDVELLAANDETYTYSKKTTSHSFGRSESVTEKERLVTNVGSRIEAGGNIMINTQLATVEEGPHAGETAIQLADSRNVTIRGSDLQADGEIIAAAGDTLSIEAGESSYEYERRKTKRGFAGLSGSASRENHERLATRSTDVQGTEGVTLISGGDTNVLASQIASDDDIHVGAGLDGEGSINIVSGRDIARDAKAESSFSFGLGMPKLFESEAYDETTEQSFTAPSRLTAGGRISLTAPDDIRITGSDLTGKAGIDMEAGDDLVIGAAAESMRHARKERELELTALDLGQALTQPHELIQAEDGQLKFRIGEGRYDAEDLREAHITQRGSQLVSDGDIRLQADHDLSVIGSRVLADHDDDGQGAAILRAGDDLSIIDASEQSTSDHEETHGKAEVSLVVQHQAVEVAKAVEGLNDARQQLEQAQDDYADYRQTLKQAQDSLDRLEQDHAAGEPGVTWQDVQDLREQVADLKDDEAWYRT
ncbi:hemagglutinin repeat-containing protein, partial [Litchfieldella qijiaojingensis]|uniref:hemagglutinin repeat-containing protein n=1 Tax=Litchfieldella qijiaojingensis TaxID=980347 RepID=UPI001671E92B